MAKQERKASDYVTAKEAGDYLCVTAKVVRGYHHRGLLKGRQYLPKGRVWFRWGAVLHFARGIKGDDE